MSNAFQAFITVVAVTALAIALALAAGFEVPGVNNPSPTQPEVDREGPEDRNN